MFVCDEADPQPHQSPDYDFGGGWGNMGALLCHDTEAHVLLCSTVAAIRDEEDESSSVKLACIPPFLEKQGIVVASRIIRASPSKEFCLECPHRLQPPKQPAVVVCAGFLCLVPDLVVVVFSTFFIAKCLHTIVSYGSPKKPKYDLPHERFKPLILEVFDARSEKHGASRLW